MIWVLTPGGFENFVDEVSVPAEAPTVPPPGVVPPENAAEIVRRHTAWSCSPAKNPSQRSRTVLF